MKAQRLYPKGLLKRYSASAYMQEPIAAISEPSGQALVPNINAPTTMTGLCYLVVFGSRPAKAHLTAPATWRLVFLWALWDFVNAAHKAETRRFSLHQQPYRLLSAAPESPVLGARPGRGGASVQLVGFLLGARWLMACESSDLSLTASD